MARTPTVKNIFVASFWAGHVAGLMGLWLLLVHAARLPPALSLSLALAVAVVFWAALLAVVYGWLRIIGHMRAGLQKEASPVDLRATRRRFLFDLSVLILLSGCQFLLFRQLAASFSLVPAGLSALLAPLVLLICAFRACGIGELLWPGESLVLLRWIACTRFHWSLLILRHQALLPRRLVQRAHVLNSYFFRHFASYESLLRDRYAAVGTPLRILCVGIGRGEEPYSISAFCVKAKIPVSILGVDISERGVARAKEAVYSVRADMKRPPDPDDPEAGKVFEEHRETFVVDGGAFSPKPEVRKNVEFRVGDARTLGLPAEFDFVFARKMLFFLPEDGQRQALRSFIAALKPGLPPSKHLLFCDSTYELVPDIEAMIAAEIARRPLR